MYEKSKEDYFPPNFKWLISRKQSHKLYMFICFIDALSIYNSIFFKAFYFETK